MHPSSFAGPPTVKQYPRSQPARHAATPTQVLEMLGIDRVRPSAGLKRLPPKLRSWLARIRITTLPPAAIAPAQATAGLRLLRNPGILLLCQILWIGIFLYMGRSQVTGAHITFHVRKDRI